MQETLSQLNDLNNTAMTESSRAAQRLVEDDMTSVHESKVGA